MIAGQKHPAPGDDTSLLNALNRSFLSAYLLTKNAAEAEKAVLDAIENWDIEKHDEQQFLEFTPRVVASQMEVVTSTEPCEGSKLDICIPVELRHVMELPADLRRCFVLRTLVGISAQICAETLLLTVSQVQGANCEAMHALAVLDRKTNLRGSKLKCQIDTTC